MEKNEKENGKSKKKNQKNTLLKCIVSILIVGTLTVGVPFIINEAYKNNTGYVTMWEAADVLSYYGTLLGALLAVVTLTITILFTKKQLQRESYLNTEKTKWSQTEVAIAQALDKICPLPLAEETIGENSHSASTSIATFQMCQMNFRTATDNLLAHLNSEDYPKVKVLIDKIIELSDSYFDLANEKIKAYTEFNALEMRQLSEKILELQSNFPSLLSAREIEKYKKILSDTDNLIFDNICKEIEGTNVKIIQAYQNTYRPLLQLKNSTFEAIYKEIDKNANDILLFW